MYRYYLLGYVGAINILVDMTTGLVIYKKRPMRGINKDEVLFFVENSFDYPAHSIMNWMHETKWGVVNPSRYFSIDGRDLGFGQVHIKVGTGRTNRLLYVVCLQEFMKGLNLSSDFLQLYFSCGIELMYDAPLIYVMNNCIIKEEEIPLLDLLGIKLNTSNLYKQRLVWADGGVIS